MASTRRIGSQTSASRNAIVRGAMKVLHEQGAASLTAAKVAQSAGVKPHLVHYYFRSIDDLIVAVVRAYGALGLKNTARIIASDEPLRALWEVEISSTMGGGMMELAAMATNRDEIRLEMARYIEEMRMLQAEGVARHFELRGIEPPAPAVALTFILSGIARTMVREKALGVAAGHREVVAVIEQLLASLPRRAEPKAPHPPSS